MTALVLKTPRLVLRPPVAEDAPRICALAANWNVARMTARMPHPYTIEDAYEYLAHVQAAAESGEAMQLAIVLDGGFIGGIGIGPRDGSNCGPSDGRPSLGYWIGEPYWGNAYMSEAAIAVVRHFFMSRSDPILTSAYLDENTASRKIQARLGFEIVRRVMHHPRSRDAQAPGVETELTREQFLALNP